MFDIDGNGVISRQELKETKLKLDSSLTDDHIEAMMAEVDSDNDGSISYIEFAKLMADKWKRFTIFLAVNHLAQISRALKFSRLF